MKNSTSKAETKASKKAKPISPKEKPQKKIHQGERNDAKSANHSKNSRVDEGGSFQETKNKRIKESNQKNVTVTNRAEKPLDPKSTATSKLEEAIYSLGGDEEDYILLKDVNDDGDAPLDKNDGGVEDPSLKRDLKKLMKELRLDSVKKNKEPKGWIVNEDQVKQDDGSQESSEFSSYNVEEDKGHPMEIKTIQASAGTEAVSNKAPGESKFIFSPDPRWYDVLPALPPTERAPTSEQIISSLQARASSLFIADTENYAAYPMHTTSTSDATFLSRVLSSGTLSDRLSALTLMVQASPLHNTRALESLRGIASKRGGAGAGKAEGVKAVRALVDWWVGGGAPGRKLKYFRDQPLLHPQRTDAHLVLWYFEDWLKKFFFSVLQILEALTHDTLSYMRLQSLQFLSTLLTSQPEQEHNLLKLLANKLGDSERPVSSRASYYLLNLLQSHPGMKAVVVREVADLILKSASHSRLPSSKNGKDTPAHSGINVNARYYGIITFNQIVLSSKEQGDRDVANRLLEIYFEVFKDLLGEGNPKDKRDIRNSLEAGSEKHVVEGQGREERRKLREKARLKALRDKGTGVSQGVLSDQNINDADSKLISALLTGVNRALVYASIDDVVLDKQMDTLFRLTHEGGGSFNVSVQALGLIAKVAERRPAIQTRYMRALYSTLLDPRLGISSKQAMYLNLLFKSLKADRDLPRIKAFVKRFVQILVVGGSGGGPAEMSFVCGGLYLLGELVSVTPDLRAAFANSPNPKQAELYDPRKREPEFARAGDTCLWELVPLLYHYHPSVSLHARQLLEKVPLTANADLSLNTFSHFLDLFVYKNPKKPKPRGASAMQPAAASQDPGTVRMVRGWGDGLGEETMVNKEAFWKKGIEEVPASQLFFHKYFNKKFEKRKLEKKMERTNDVEGQMSDSDPEEAEVWAAMKRSIPAAEGAGADPDEEDDSEGLPDPEDSESEATSEQQGEDQDISESLVSGSELSSTLSSAALKGKAKADGCEADSDSDAFAFGEASDDVLNSDDQLDGSVGEALLHLESDEDNESWHGIGESGLGKRKRKPVDDGKQKKKRRLKDLPLFASLEDYETLIDAQPEDNI